MVWREAGQKQSEAFGPGRQLQAQAFLRDVEFSPRATEGSLADYRREADRYLPEHDSLAAIPAEKVTVGAIRDWHIRLRRRAATPAPSVPRIRVGSGAQRPMRSRPSNSAKSMKSAVFSVANGSPYVRQQAAIQLSFTGRGRPRRSA